MSDSHDLTDTPTQKFIVIRFSDVTIADLQINITQVPISNINTHWLRQMCRDLRPRETQSHRLKFIRSGALLNSRSSLALQIQDYFRTSASDHTPQQEEEEEEANKFYIHCIIGSDLLSEDELAREDAMDDLGPNEEGRTTQAIGFDRLRAVGFSEREIELLRQQFRSTYGDLEERLQGNDEFEEEGNNNSTTDIRQLEEQWMESGGHGPTNENGMANNNVFDDDRFNSIPITNLKHNKDLLIGIFIGFCFGIFAFILMNIDGLLNKRQRMSMFAGIIVNILFCLFRGF
ncbi:hypothetical protein NCAS_0B01370 [Naumovozyma castellii]|uniref:DSC E3 ubiquitin ligase complex subunit 3 C-terminal domain-containing protein n=1 Tax=Naumovozyma castellii TaxID=27288 RepID=G0VB97_NAUCA|nr:hypothetical protein NCAS_0B01370 [Naumovozyma castellii CBS 4309]CCC68221.1 hypothetical protein NCAS_0B01370 [Naumovozyma castellii CBS 4309]